MWADSCVDPHYAISSQSNNLHTLPHNIIDKVVGTMATHFGLQSSDDLRPLVSMERLQVWSRVKVLHGGDTMRVVRLDESQDDRRSASFVSVSGLTDTQISIVADVTLMPAAVYCRCQPMEAQFDQSH